MLLQHEGISDGELSAKHFQNSALDVTEISVCPWPSLPIKRTVC